MWPSGLLRLEPKWLLLLQLLLLLLLLLQPPPPPPLQPKQLLPGGDGLCP